MKLVKLYSLIIVVGLTIVIGCDTSSITNNNSLLTSSPEISSDLINGDHENDLKATGEFYASWIGCGDESGNGGQGEDNGGCEDGCEDENPTGHEDDGCDHEDDGNNGGNQSHPARDIYVRFDAQQNKGIVKGEVIFKGVGDYEGIEFTGKVTWIKRWDDTNYAGIERTDKDLLFGGVITSGTVGRQLFMFSIRDNDYDQVTKDLPDRLQYRLYNPESDQHYPKGYPFALYEGNLMVHK